MSKLEYRRDNRLGTAQDVHLSHMRSHLSALQNCALILSTNFQFIFKFQNNALHNLVIELWSALNLLKQFTTIY